MKDDQSYRRYSRKGEGRHGATRNDIGDHGLLFRGIVLRLPVRQKLLSLKFDFERAKLACPFESIFEQFPRQTMSNKPSNDSPRLRMPLSDRQRFPGPFTWYL
jgi:hypothetical protein